MTAKAFPIIDVHQHAGPWPFPGRWGSVALNVHYLECRGIDAAIASATEAIVDDMAAGNARLAKDIAPYPCLYGYVTVNPRHVEQSVRQIETYYTKPQFVGAKIHTGYAGTPMGDPRVADMLAVLETYGKPLLIHTWGASAVHALAGLAKRFPTLPIIAAHAGADAWREAIQAASEAPNLYLDFSWSSPERGRIERAIGALGPEQVMFGTDATLFDPQYMLSCFWEAEIAEKDLPLVMGGNAERVFGLPTLPSGQP